MKGPGVKKNYLMERTMWLTDIVPTICYLADLPIPEHAEGGILYQALENPNLKLDEIKKIKENYERLKSAYEGEQALSHTYHM